MPTSSASEVFALIDGRKNTTSARTWAINVPMHSWPYNNYYNLHCVLVVVLVFFIGGSDFMLCSVGGMWFVCVCVCGALDVTALLALHGSSSGGTCSDMWWYMYYIKHRRAVDMPNSGLRTEVRYLAYPLPFYALYYKSSGCDIMAYHYRENCQFPQHGHLAGWYAIYQTWPSYIKPVRPYLNSWMGWFGILTTLLYFVWYIKCLWRYSSPFMEKLRSFCSSSVRAILQVDMPYNKPAHNT